MPRDRNGPGALFAYGVAIVSRNAVSRSFSFSTRLVTVLEASPSSRPASLLVYSKVSSSANGASFGFLSWTKAMNASRSSRKRSAAVMSFVAGISYVDGSSEVGWVDVEHTQRAKDAPRPLVFRDSALKTQIAAALGWEVFDADRMFETLFGISVNVDVVTLHFKEGGAQTFRYVPPKQIHRKRKVET